MHKRKYFVLAGAVLAVMPLAANAAAIMNYTWDFSTFGVSTTPGGTTFVTLVPTGTATNASITVPAGFNFRFGVDGVVTGNANTFTDQSGSANQATQLGMTQWGLGITTTNKTNAGIVGAQGSAPTGVRVDPGGLFTTTTNAGVVNSNGGVDASTGLLGANANGVGAPMDTNAKVANTDIGGALTGSTPNSVVLFDRLRFLAGSSGTADLQLTSLDQGFGFVSSTAAGANPGDGDNAPTYANLTGTNASNLAALPVLHVTIAGASGPTPIISLTAAAPSGFGTRLDSTTATFNPNTTDPSGGPNDRLLNPIGSGATGYVPAFAHVTAGAGTATANLKESGMAATDPHLYVLKLEKGGVDMNAQSDATYAADIATLVSEINAASGHTGFLATASDFNSSILASDPRFAGYDILLSEAANAGSNPEFLGFDFSSGANAGVAGITVSDVAAIPEPATIGLAGIASSLLVLRRKRRA